MSWLGLYVMNQTIAYQTVFLQTQFVSFREDHMMSPEWINQNMTIAFQDLESHLFELAKNNGLIGNLVFLFAIVFWVWHSLHYMDDFIERGKNCCHGFRFIRFYLALFFMISGISLCISGSTQIGARDLIKANALICAGLLSFLIGSLLILWWMYDENVTLHHVNHMEGNNKNKHKHKAQDDDGSEPPGGQPHGQLSSPLGLPVGFPPQHEGESKEKDAAV